MQNNLIFLSGPQGSGKTTLVSKLSALDPRIVDHPLYSRNIKFNEDPKLRNLLKISGRAIENYEYLHVAKESPEKIFLIKFTGDKYAHKSDYCKH